MQGSVGGVAPYADSPWHARFWMGFGLPAWSRFLRLGLRECAGDAWPMILLYSLLSPLNSILGLVDDLLEPDLSRLAPAPDGPLFVIGHWRTGTTLLHELLAADPAAVAPTTYQCMAPLHFRFTQEAAPRLLPFLMPDRRPMDAMPAGWDRPQEDEFALAALGVPSPYLAFAFGRPVDPEYLDLEGVPAPAVAAWGRALRNFVDRVRSKAPGRRLVLKSPPHTARIRRLLEIFPGARFLHLVRHPARIFPSTLHLFRELHRVHRAGPPGWPGLEELVLATLPRLYAAFDRDRPSIPPGRYHLLRYEELVADPVARLGEAYDRLSLGDSTPVAAAATARLAQLRDFPRNAFPAEPSRDARVLERWGAYAAAYGYGPLGRSD